MIDEYATLRAACAAGLRIQAWALNDGATGSKDGYWRDLVRLDGERPSPAFTCPAHLYRVHPEDQHPAEAPVAFRIEERAGRYTFCEAKHIEGNRRMYEGANIAPLYLRPDPELAALRAEVERLRTANDHYQMMMNTAACDEYRNRVRNAEATIARVRALADRIERVGENLIEPQEVAYRYAAKEIRAALEGSNRGD